MKNKRFIAVGVGVALVVIGIIGAVSFVKTKPQAQRKRAMSSMVPVVETMPWTVSSLPRVVDGLGTVIADKSAMIKSEVSGRIVAVSDALIEGGLVKKGELLMEIDDAEYRYDVADAEGDLLDAQADLRLEEGNQAVARHEMTLIGEAVDEAYKDLMLREPQLQSAQATVMSAQAALDTAKLDVERTKIRAPYDAVIVSVDADVGDYATTSTELVELAATSRYFIRASVPLRSLTPLPMLGKTPYSARLTLSDGSELPAETFKLLPDLTATGRMAQLLLVVNDPYGVNGRPLLLNEMVSFRIQGDVVDGVSLLPRRYLRDGNVVWMIDDAETLHILSAEVLQGYADEVLVRVDGIDGMELVTTDLSAASEGMQLRRVGAQEGSEGRNAPDGPSVKKQGAAQ
jgi:RND family efflux transporter MFP subunit